MNQDLYLQNITKKRVSSEDLLKDSP